MIGVAAGGVVVGVPDGFGVGGFDVTVPPVPTVPGVPVVAGVPVAVGVPVPTVPVGAGVTATAGGGLIGAAAVCVGAAAPGVVRAAVGCCAGAVPAGITAPDGSDAFVALAGLLTLPIVPDCSPGTATAFESTN